MEISAITWNLFHGRDFPPDPALFTWRSWLLGTEERNATHVQVNRDLFDEFAGILAGARWDVALLQELPPRWAHRLASACRADMQLTLTSRNWLRSIRRAVAERRPDLMGAWEGGANAIFARGKLRSRLGAKEIALRGPPERRMLTLARLDPGLVVANLHASVPSPLAAEDVRRAAEAAVGFAGDDPLILGGDFNVSPGGSEVFDELAGRFDLHRPTDQHSIDHLLARGLQILDPPTAWPDDAREVSAGDLAIRLSDHAPVKARFGWSPE
jgi:endonuclease/exonuclease/phosphatase family metal-dependent hydrolase